MYRQRNELGLGPTATYATSMHIFTLLPEEYILERVSPKLMFCSHVM